MKVVCVYVRTINESPSFKNRLIDVTQNYSLDRAKAVEATGLLLQIKFLLLLVMFDRMLTCTKSLSKYLQHAQINLARGAYLVSEPARVSTLQFFLY